MKKGDFALQKIEATEPDEKTTEPDKVVTTEPDAVVTTEATTEAETDPVIETVETEKGVDIVSFVDYISAPAQDAARLYIRSFLSLLREEHLPVLVKTLLLPREPRTARITSDILRRLTREYSSILFTVIKQ